MPRATLAYTSISCWVSGRSIERLHGVNLNQQTNKHFTWGTKFHHKSSISVGHGLHSYVNTGAPSIASPSPATRPLQLLSPRMGTGWTNLQGRSGRNMGLSINRGIIWMVYNGLFQGKIMKNPSINGWFGGIMRYTQGKIHHNPSINGWFGGIPRYPKISGNLMKPPSWCHDLNWEWDHEFCRHRDLNLDILWDSPCFQWQTSPIAAGTVAQESRTTSNLKSRVTHTLCTCICIYN